MRQHNTDRRNRRLRHEAADSCPTCGAVLKNIMFWVDLENNILIVENRAIQVGPQIAVLLHTLRKRYPYTVAKEQLIQSVWGGMSEMTDANLKVLAALARKPLRAVSNWEIKLNYGVGYRLVRQ